MSMNFELPLAGAVERLGPQACVLRGFALDDAPALLAAVAAIEADAPFRHMVTPGGRTMSVALTNCGALGWHADLRGYRYTPLDPLTGRPWPPMPDTLRALAVAAAEAAGFAGFEPDACLVNRYRPGTRLTLHQDRNERDFAQPIVGTPSTSPRWLAMPKRRGWATPWPSTMITSGAVFSFLQAERSGGISRNDSRPGM